MAEDLLDDLDELTGEIVNIDKVLARAERLGVESVYRRLVEISLRHRLGPYHKSRAFEGLLAHQTRY